MQRIISILSVFSFSISFLNAAPVKSGKATADLLVKHTSVPVGEVTLLALRLIPEAGWHTYWQNPGASGMPTSVKWELPKGITVSELQFPAPHIFESSGMKSLGFEGEVIILAELNISKDAKPGDVEIIGNATWLTCVAHECIPGDAKMKVSLKVLAVGQKTVARDSAELITKAEVEMPSDEKHWTATCKQIGDKLELRIKPAPSVKMDTEGLKVFVVQQSVVLDGESTEWKMVGGEIIGQMAVSKYLDKLPGKLDLVLVGAGQTRGVKIVCEIKK